MVSSESADYLLAKIQAYLQHGSKCVWVVFPERRAVQIYTGSGQNVILGETENLEDQSALPGFTTPVTAFFEGL